MRIRVSPQSLARQIPLLRHDIISIFEDDFILEGDDVTATVPLKGTMAALFPILLKDPELSKIFTSKELAVITVMYEHECTVEGISEAVYSMVTPRTGNNASVHIKNIRGKIKSRKLPYRIVTYGKRPMFFRFEKCG